MRVLRSSVCACMSVVHVMLWDIVIYEWAVHLSCILSHYHSVVSPAWMQKHRHLRLSIKSILHDLQVYVHYLVPQSLWIFHNYSGTYAATPGPLQVCNCWPPTTSVSASNCYDFSPLTGVSDCFTPWLPKWSVHVRCMALPACVGTFACTHDCILFMLALLSAD